MSKPNRAREVRIEAGSLLFDSDEVETAYTDTLDSRGRFSGFGKWAGKKAVLIILK